jgi:hypothetical protein
MKAYIYISFSEGSFEEFRVKAELAPHPYESKFSGPSQIEISQELFDRAIAAQNEWDAIQEILQPIFYEK